MHSSRPPSRIRLTVPMLLLSLLLAGADNEAVSQRVERVGTEDGAWRHAVVLGEMTGLGTTDLPARERTQILAMHDGDSLALRILGAGAPAAHEAKLKHDSEDIWRRERIEIFVDPTPETDDYFHLVLDRSGNRLDARHGEDGLAWNATWEGRIENRPKGWMATVRIPFASLHVEPPQPGDLYRLKVGRDGGQDGPLCWPPNASRSFHSREADGALYFETVDLLRNGGFEEGDPVAGAPPPWQPSMTSPEVKNAPQGTVETIADGGTEGSRALRVTKLASALWWPQIWNGGYVLRPGGTYEFSVMARGTLPQVNLRATAVVDGQQVKMSSTHATPKEWERLRFVFGVPERASGVSVGLSAPAGITGEVLYDQARLRRVLAAPGTATVRRPLTADPDPDPVQGLAAFMERQGTKPHDLFQDGESLLTHRIIFADRQFGTRIWMLDDSPTADHTGTASVWSAWNPTGTALFVEGARQLGKETRKGWFFTADFSRLVPSRGGRPAVWDPEAPDFFYSPASPTNQVTRTHWRTGEQRVVAEWEPLSWPASGQRLYGMTRDRRHLFIDLPNRGIFVPFVNDETKPIPRLGMYDGRPIGPGGKSIGANHNTVILQHETHGDLIALRTGMLIDRETGEKICIAAPLCGNTNYLRAFQEGRVKYPRGEEWNAYGLPWFARGVRLPEKLSMEELYQLWRNLPHATHGHESPSPDWQHIAMDGGATVIARVRDGHTQSIRLSPNGGNYHLQWTKHPRFLVGWVRGWSFGSYLRPENANIEFQIFADGTFQPIVDTKHNFNGYYSGGDFSMFSPDATKIHYGSSMTGRFRNYVAVMARPRPPEGLEAKRQDTGVLLRWRPSAYANETRGYLVYRSPTSGDGYRLLTGEPVPGTEYVDATDAAGTPHHYVVTSLEHCGLESGYSAEAVVGPAKRLVVYAEAEISIRDLDTEERPGLAFGVDRRTASDWGFLYRHPEATEGSAELNVSVPASGTYHLWARLRNARPGGSSWQIAAAGRNLSLSCAGDEWTWIRAEGAPLACPKGTVRLRLRTTDATAQMDLLCLATDAAFVPAGPRPERIEPPQPVATLHAQNLRPRANRLSWQASPNPAFSHYNVYAATDGEVRPTQEFLVGSPTEPTFLDWGLKAGKTYRYAVTVVDRRGNESPPTAAQATTPPAPPPTVHSLAFADAEAIGDFERKEGEAAYGKTYLVPQSPDTNAVSWRIDIPRDGTYYLWLRYLPRGDGNRGGEIRQSLRVRIDGETVTTELGGGLTDLHVPDSFLAPEHPRAPRLWTWAHPGSCNLVGIPLAAGSRTIGLDRLAPKIRYDALVITDEPSWTPPDGRLRQR